MWQPTHVKVTVKQAKSLLTKGKNGTNDVFVVIGIGKEKYQTSIKEKALPTVEWREECELAIPSQGNVANLQLTVYHHNAIGLDEFLGQVSMPLSDFDVYEKPKYRFYRLKGKPDKDKKKGEKDRGELEVMVNFTVKSGSYLDLSKKEKQKSSLTSLKHLGGSLMSIGAKEKQGLRNFAKSVSSKMDKIAKPKRKKSKTPSENSSSGLSNDLMISQQRYGDADPGVISDDDDDDFKFDDDVKVNTRTSSPMSTMSRGSSLMHDQVLDTDYEVGSYEDPEHDFSYSFGKPPRIVDGNKGLRSPHEFQRMTTEKVTSFSDPDPSVQIRTNTPEISRTIIEEEPSFDLKDEPSFDLNKEPTFDLKKEPYYDLKEEPYYDLKKEPSFNLKEEPNYGLKEESSFNLKEEPYYGLKEEPYYGLKEEPIHSVPVDVELDPSDRNLGSIDLGPPIELPKRAPRKLDLGGLHPEESKKDSFSSVKSFGDSNGSFYSPNEEKSFYSIDHQGEETKKPVKLDTKTLTNDDIYKEKSSSKRYKNFTFLEDSSEPEENFVGNQFSKSANFQCEQKSKTVENVVEKPILTTSFRDEFQSKDQKRTNETTDNFKPKIVSTHDSTPFLNLQSEKRDGRDSAISLSHDPDSIVSSAISSRPRSNSNASSILSSASETKEIVVKSSIPPYISESSPKTLLKSSSDLDVLLRQMSAGKKKNKRVISASDSSKFIDLGDSQIVRSDSLNERRPSIGANSSPVTVGTPPTMIDEWERKLYGRSGMTGSTENVSITGSRSSLNTSRESSIHDVRKEDSFTRLPEVKALTLEKIFTDPEEDGKKQKRKPKTGFKNRFFNKLGGSRERLNEDSRFVEGGNDRLPTIPSRSSKLPQEVHDKFAGKSREDLLEVILNLQSSLEKQVKHSSDLEEYIDNLLLRVMEATPHILQAPVKTGPAFKYDRKALGYF